MQGMRVVAYVSYKAAGGKERSIKKFWPLITDKDGNDTIQPITKEQLEAILKRSKEVDEKIKARKENGKTGGS